MPGGHRRHRSYRHRSRGVRLHLYHRPRGKGHQGAAGHGSRSPDPGGGSQRHPATLGEDVVGSALDRPARADPAGLLGHRHRLVGPEGQAGKPAALPLPGGGAQQDPRVQHRLRLVEPRPRGDGPGGRRLRRPGNPRSQDQGGQGEPLRRRGARPGGEEGGGRGRQAHGRRQPALDRGRSHGPLPSPGRPGPLLDGGALGCRRRAGPRAIEPTHLHPHCAGREPLQPARLQGIPGAGSRQPSCNPTSAVWASPSG